MPSIDHSSLREISPSVPTASPSAAHISTGIPISPQQRVTLFSPHDWEAFTEEWASSLKSRYSSVKRFGGSGDFGLDVVGFHNGETFEGGWDNYQCKRYGAPITPSDIWREIGKIVLHSFNGKYPPPIKFYFVGSKGIGTSLQNLLARPDELKSQVRVNWAKYCESGLSIEATPLSGDLEAYYESFDFSIFASVSVVGLIEGHSKTQFYSIRFGGGLPLRPNVQRPPDSYQSSESKYIQQLLLAYSDEADFSIASTPELGGFKDFSKDFLRQRERFYHAESLRNFARDTVPEGTFERLQDEVYHGVADTCDGEHSSGFQRMRATISQAATISMNSNPLTSVVEIQDKQGICHQLANDDRLTWVADKAEEDR